MRGDMDMDMDVGERIGLIIVDQEVGEIHGGDYGMDGDVSVG